MGTLYTCVDQNGRKNIIVLNPKYSRKELEEKLEPTGCSENWIERVVTEGIILKKKLRIKCRADGFITTQKWGSMYYIYKGDTVNVYPDGSFCVKPSIFRKLFH